MPIQSCSQPLCLQNEVKILNMKNDEIRAEVAEGLRYTHSRANSNTAKLLEVSSFVYAVIEQLAEKGLIEIEVLDRKKEIADRLVEKFRQEGIGGAYQDPEHDKYTFESSVEIATAPQARICFAHPYASFEFATEPRTINLLPRFISVEILCKGKRKEDSESMNQCNERPYQSRRQPLEAAIC